MRISHRRKKIEPKKNYIFNEGIQFPSVLVLDSSGANLGVMNTGEAIRLAKEQEMELVLINPKVDPPAAKIMDLGQFQYQQEKAERIRKAHQHVVKIKNLRLTIRIGKHDLDIRAKQAVNFLNSGDKVKIEIMLKGRENQQANIAFEMIKNFIRDINEQVKTRFEQDVEKLGNIIAATIAKE